MNASHSHLDRTFTSGRHTMSGLMILLAIALLLAMPTIAFGQSTSSGPIVWTGAGRDGRWSNAANWAAGRVPTLTDIVRIPASAGDMSVDADFAGNIAGLQLDDGFKGTLRLDRPLHVQGDLIMLSGTLDGSGGALVVNGAVKVANGLLLTPRSMMRVGSLDIRAPAVVRLSTGGRLFLLGGGTPLTGDGLLDTTTNRPNAVEYAGKASSSIDTATPAAGLNGLNLRSDSAVPTPAGRSPLFSVTPISLTLNAGEDLLSSAVIDAANGFAYFAATNLSTLDGYVVKVRLSDFTRVGALALPAGETMLYSGAIDTVHGYAYFGSYNLPAFVVKINTSPSSFGYVGSVQLPDGIDFLSAAVVDPARGFAYFGTSDLSPASIAKINLNGAGAPTFNSTITLQPGEDMLMSAIIDTTNGLAYFSAADLSASAGHIVKVSLTPTFTRTASLTLNPGENFLGLAVSGSVIDAANAFGYFGTNSDATVPVAAGIVKVNLSGSMSRVGVIRPFDSSINQIGTGVIDPTDGYAYFSGYTAPGVVAKVQLSPSFTTVQTLTLNTGEDNPFSSVLDPVRHNLYFGLDTSPGIVARVDLANSQTTLASSANPSVFGQTVTFTATVSALPGLSTRPTGTVTFTIDGGSSLTRTLTAAGTVTSTATFTTSSLAVGAHTIAAAYGGDSTFTPSSASLSQTVNKANTTTGLSSSSNPAVFGQPITLTAIVTATSPGAGTPTGTVTFTIDGVSVAAALNASRTATYVTSTLSVATHPVTATYGGDTNFNGSTNSISQVVNRANTTTGLATSATPTVFGQPITLTAIVTATSPGAGTPTGTVTFTFDGGINVNAALNASRVATYVTSTLSVATHPIVAAYSGDTNFNGSTSNTVNQVVNKADTTTSVTSAPNPSVFGQSVTFTATVSVSAPGAGTPSGTVTFFDGATTLGTGSVNLSGVATLATSALSVGAHPNITAQYSGDGSFNGSTSSAYAHTVNKANTTTSVTSAPNPSVFGQSVTFTATVLATAPGAGTRTGSVAFFDNGASIGFGTLNASGVATLTYSALSVGAHANITATYGGDTNFNASTSSAYAHTVNKADTTTSITSAPNPSVFGQSVTFTATVLATAPGAGTRTGSVTFFDNGASIGFGTLNAGGVATLTYSALSVGTHANITATYSGDTNFNASTSGAYTHTVNKADTTTSVTSAPNPSVFGQSVTFTATVLATAPGAGTRTGSVAFFDNGASIGFGTLNASGVATLTYSALSVGAHVNITATYGGDTNFNASTSGAYAHTVNKADTTTSVTSAPNPSVFGQSVTFTATVLATAPGAGTRTGSVTFFDNGASIGSGAVNASGVATLTYSALSVGAHVNITATYGGDTNFNASTSSAYAHTVNKADTTTSVTSAPNPSVFGQSVTFTATVLATAPGAGTRTGSVAFFDNGASIGFGTLNASGIATLTYSALSVGAHANITATYSGDTNFNASTSSAYAHTVNKADTTTSVTSAPNPSVFGQSVTFTAIVTASAPGAGTPTGSITFTFDGSTSVVATLNASRVATYVTTTLSVAAHSVSAAYSGDGNFNTSSASLPTHTVNKANSATTVTSAPNPSIFGQSVTFTATVAAVAPGAGNPSGTVTFTIDAASVNVALVNGVATYSTSSLAVGAHTVSATYSGDASFNTSTGSLPTQTVNKAGTTTSVASSVNPSIFGQSVTFTATLTAVAPGAGTPTGNVTFTIDSTPFVVASSGGVATYSTSALAVGPHTVSATYGGDAGFNGSSGSLPTQTVNKSSTSTSLTSAPNPSVFGQSVTFTATVSAIAPGAGNPSGTVTFLDNGVSIGSGNVGASGIATVTTSALAVGTHANITAQYSGDTSFNGSTSGVHAHTVNKANSTTSMLVISPALFGQAWPITVSVAAAAPGSGTPTGAVNITDGTVSCNVTLPATSCNLTFNVLGSHTLTATYSGDGNFNPSSTTTPLTVVDVPITGLNAANSSPTRLDNVTTFTATQATGTNIVYTWAFGDGGPIGNGPNVTHTYALSGTYTAIVTATNSVSSQSASTPVTITNQRPVAVAFDAGFSLNSTATLDGSLSNDPDNHYPLTYYWQQTGGTSSVTFTPNLSVTTFTAPGAPTVLTFTLTVTDAHGLASLPKTVKITIADIPITGLAAGNNSPTMFGVPTQFTATVVTGSSVNYTWNFGDGTTGAGQFPAHTYGALGNYTAVVTAANSLGTFTTTTPVSIIKATPLVAITADAPDPSVVGQNVTINFSVTPPGAGTPTGTITVTDGTQSCSASVAVGACTIAFASPGGRTLTAQYSGDAFFNAATSAGASHTVNPASTTTSLSSTANPSVFGQSVTFTATVAVTAPGAGTPTGSVNFTIDGAPVGTVPLVGGAAAFTTSSLSVGSHPVVAAYGGDANFNGSTSGTLSQVVNKANTSTSVTSSANPSVFGQSVTFTVTVAASAPGAGTPTGSVTITIDGVPTVVALSGGAAGVSTSALAIGPHTVSVAYGGDGSFNASAGALPTQTVNRANSTTTVTASPNPSIISQTVTFTATVTAAAPGAGNPSGTVTFTIDSVNVATVALSGGSATYSTSSLVVGSHPVSVTYSGDGNFNAGTGSVTQIVNKPPSATSVTAAPNPSVFGQSVTFTATVTPVLGGPTPTGLVTFTIDGATAGSVALSGGSASFSTSALSAGAHPVVVTYGGDVNFEGSASATYTQTVNKANTTIGVTSAPNASVFGQNVTFTATVTVSAPGAGTPSGMVTFFDGATNIGAGTLNASGIVTLSTSALAVGAHPNITAQYAGDASFNGSTSGAYLHTVNKANSTTAVTSAPNPSVFGQSVTFTATVAASAPGAGSPSGTVTFVIDGVNVVQSLSGGLATYVTSTLSVGSHSISATYGGDGNFNGSAAGPINHNVNKANSSVTVGSSQNPSPAGQLITFTATIAAAAPGVGTPTGTVTFTIDGTAVGVRPLIGGVATFSTSALSVGAHTVAVTYGGDGNFNGSTGALPTNQVVTLYRRFLPILRR